MSFSLRWFLLMGCTSFSCSIAFGIISDQGSDPCLLHCQAGSLPPSHQGSPVNVFWLDLLSSISTTGSIPAHSPLTWTTFVAPGRSPCHSPTYSVYSAVAVPSPLPAFSSATQTLGIPWACHLFQDTKHLHLPFLLFEISLGELIFISFSVSLY